MTPRVQAVLPRLFPPAESADAAILLETQCSARLPFAERLGEAGIERVQCAVLACSGGSIESLRRAVALARTDWRDVLVAAGFANSLTAHVEWIEAQAAGGDPGPERSGGNP